MDAAVEEERVEGRKVGRVESDVLPGSTGRAVRSGSSVEPRDSGVVMSVEHEVCVLAETDERRRGELMVRAMSGNES